MKYTINKSMFVKLGLPRSSLTAFKMEARHHSTIIDLKSIPHYTSHTNPSKQNPKLAHTCR